MRNKKQKVNSLQVNDVTTLSHDTANLFKELKSLILTQDSENNKRAQFLFKEHLDNSPKRDDFDKKTFRELKCDSSLNDAEKHRIIKLEKRYLSLLDREHKCNIEIQELFDRVNKCNIETQELLVL